MRRSPPSSTVTWSAQPSADAHRLKDGSPALEADPLPPSRRAGTAQSLSVAIAGPAAVRSKEDVAVSARRMRCGHPPAGPRPRPSRRRSGDPPVLYRNSHELHIQAIHDYVGCRVWRAHRSHDANGGWKRQRPRQSRRQHGQSNLAMAAHRDQPHRDGTTTDPPKPCSTLPPAQHPVRSARSRSRRSAHRSAQRHLWAVPAQHGQAAHQAARQRLTVRSTCRPSIFHKAGGDIDMDTHFGQQTANRDRTSSGSSPC